MFKQTTIPKFIFSQEPEKEYLQLCRKNRAFFHTPEWQRVLQAGFGAQSLYGWDEKNQTGVAMTIFKAAVFRVGYIGFPAVSAINNETIDDNFIKALRRSQYELPLHAIRFSPSPFRDRVSMPKETEQTWETAITDLSAWSLNELSSNIHRNVRKAQRHLEIFEAQTGIDAQQMYGLYKETIQRHNGNLRYTKEYFHALVNLSRQNQNLRCLLAKFEGETAGFIVTANNSKSCNYLHGAFESHLGKYRPSDFLMGIAIQWAKNSNMRSFNLMASPLAQKSLVKYKERWGGETHRQHTFNIPVSQVGGKMFQFSVKLYRHLQKVLKR